jgi:hypothetical protein
LYNKNPTKNVSLVKREPRLHLISRISSTNKTDRHDITEILLKVALNTINKTNMMTSAVMLAPSDYVPDRFYFANEMHMGGCGAISTTRNLGGIFANITAEVSQPLENELSPPLTNLEWLLTLKYNAI